MSGQDDFFTPEDVDRQIDQVSRFQRGEQADAEVMAYLRNFYWIDARQEQAMLGRIWNRISDAAPSLQRSQQQNQGRDEVSAMRNQPALLSNQVIHKRRITLWQRLSVLAAAVILAALIGSAAIIFSSIRHNAGGPASGTPKPTAIVTTTPQRPTPSPTAKPVPFKVTSVAMSVTPGSIAGMTCGTNVTVTYTATIHVMPHGPGGVVQFSYTVDNGRSQTPARITFAPGETSKTYSFTWSGALPPDHTYPGQGGIAVTSPNQLISSRVGPVGACVSEATFAVTGIDMAVSPSSIQGLTCGSSIVVTYTATIHAAANSPGGTVQFSYTVDNGRSLTPASVIFTPGETSKTYSFTWSGVLPADHTYPQPGGISVTSPNQLISSLVKPEGTCQ